MVGGSPVAVKLSPFFSSMANLASELDSLGADGLLLFNRFYQPDVDPEMLLAAPRLQLSSPMNCCYGCAGSRFCTAESSRRSRRPARSRQVRGAEGHPGRSGRSPGRLRASRTRHWPPGPYPAGTGSLAGATHFTTRFGRSWQCQPVRIPHAEAFERGNYMRILQSWRPRSRPRGR